MINFCIAGKCHINCHGACVCWSDADDPEDCECYCLDILKPVNKKFKHPMKVTPRAKYNICAKSMPITQLALIFDKMLPYSILIPANAVTKIVTLSLKNKTFRQIIIASGLAVKR